MGKEKEDQRINSGEIQSDIDLLNFETGIDTSQVQIDVNNEDIEDKIKMQNIIDIDQSNTEAESKDNLKSSAKRNHTIKRKSLGDQFFELASYAGKPSNDQSNKKNNVQSDKYNNFLTDCNYSSAIKESNDSDINQQHNDIKSHKKSNSSLHFIGSFFTFPFHYQHKRYTSTESNISMDVLGEEGAVAEPIDCSSLNRSKNHSDVERDSMDSHHSISILDGLRLRIIHLPKWKYRVMVGTILFLLIVLAFSSICSVIYGYSLKMPFFEMKNQRITSYSINEETKGVNIAFSIDIKLSNYNSFPIHLDDLRTNAFFSEEKKYLLATGDVEKLDVHSYSNGEGVLVLDFQNLNLRPDGQELLRERREQKYSVIYSSTVLPFTVKVLGFIPYSRKAYVMCTTILIWDGSGNAASECQTEIGKGFIYKSNPLSFEPMPYPPLQTVPFPEMAKQTPST